jgi:orotate phosphoribosyltransferase
METQPATSQVQHRLDFKSGELALDHHKTLLADLVEPLTADLVAHTLVEAGAYKITTAEPDEWFEWKSGIKAPVYTDTRVINGNNRTFGGLKIINFALGRMVHTNFSDGTLVVGLAEGGVVWSRGVVGENGYDHAWVRKHAKKHGIGGMIAGSPSPGTSAVLVDDLIASGGTVLRAVEALTDEYGIKSVGVACVVTWGFPSMRQKFEQGGIKIKALTSYPWLLSAAYRKGIISEAAVAELASFYADPKGHTWNLDALK